MKHTSFYLTSLLLIGTAFSASAAVMISLSNSDFTNTPIFSNVVTYDIQIEVGGSLQPGLFADPVLNNIQYSVSGNLDSTPSGFPAFLFRLDHRFPSSPPITGDEFYALNPSSISGTTLQYSISATADLSDGLQVNELDELPQNPAAGIGPRVVFHFNGREEGTGRYHPLFLQLKSDGTGILQNANNQGGINPVTKQEVNLDFGDEYITQLSFEPSTFTIAVPEPSSAVIGALCLAAMAVWRRARLQFHAGSLKDKSS